MKLLNKILLNTDAEFVCGNENLSIAGITTSSRDVKENYAFFALVGTKTDGHTFIDDAIKAGATAIICSKIPENKIENITYYVTKNGNETWAQSAANYYENPSKNIDLIGITGTNGKTTTVTLLFELFNKLEIPAGLISTIKCNTLTKEYVSTHTTPDALEINRLLREMVDAGCKYCFMEVSSHAVVQSRIHGLHFKGGVFTNLTHDHLDYHKTFAEYLKAKQMFFTSLPKTAFALYNDDDVNGAVMVQNSKANKFSYAIKRPADFKTKILHNSIEGLELNINGLEAWFKLVGNFNAYNLTAIYATAAICGVDSSKIIVALSSLDEADGRFNVVRSNSGITGIVDYAHTPDALKNVLTTIIDIRESGCDIITVAGAGGDRDKTKRGAMGEIIAAYSEKVIITSDNPRTEDPVKIIEDVKSGVKPEDLKKVICISDRREAIKTACMLAKAGDIILVAGKGHETYQEIMGVRNHFNDMEELNEFLNK
ncbi:MAG: UDP-N-acetylmuramoyl-L-alanyl-D-glutamate--2,6-diaminopimelate ligase [Bacteroidales bacterium]|nr:UDP-N-acetylmuramoyl-L-alanyl-D-glutamate--2,6-diaminopimelate ligase [Bacteroidales bacterium]